MLADQLDYVVGVDPHRDTHALAIVDVRTGGVVFEATTVADGEHMILVTRRRAHAPTIAYINRRIQEGKSRREANRCPKRYLARSLYRLLEHRPPLAT